MWGLVRSLALMHSIKSQCFHNSFMRIGIISGSHRPDSQSEKVAEWIREALTQRSVETFSVNLSNNQLPMWATIAADEERDEWKTLSPELIECWGFVAITPEWGGMATPAIKNFFLHGSAKEFGHKPNLLVTVSGGRGGAYPISEMRASSYKNNRINHIPEHIIVRDAVEVLNDHEPEEQADIYLQERLSYSLDLLCRYALALKGMRDHIEFDLEKYVNGMS